MATISTLRYVQNDYTSAPWNFNDATPGKDYLSNRFAKTITGPYKQDIAMLLQGQKGSGKSYASLRIAYNTARRIAEIRDGDWRDWPEYFNMEENVAIIDPVRASEMIGNAKLYNIYLFDDIGVGWNARAFASRENRAKNDIFQINRVSQTFQILSMPNQFLLDKVPRMLCNYVAEMDGSNFRYGLSTMKIFKAKTIFRLNNLRVTPHLVASSGEKIVKHVISAPPKFLSEEYDRIRKETTERIIAARSGEEEEGGSSSGRRTGPAPSVISDAMIIRCIEGVEARLVKGMTEKEAILDYASSPEGRADEFTYNRFYHLKKVGRLADHGYHRTGPQ